MLIMTHNFKTKNMKIIVSHVMAAYNKMTLDIRSIINDEQVNMDDYSLDWCKMVTTRLDEVSDEYDEMGENDEYFPIERILIVLGDLYEIYEYVVDVVDRAPELSRMTIDWKVMNSIRDRMEEFMGK